jgi:hypothetical protein
MEVAVADPAVQQLEDDVVWSSIPSLELERLEPSAGLHRCAPV